VNYRTYRTWKAVIVMIIAASVSSAVVAGNAWVPVPAAVAGAIILLFLRRRVKEVVIDERTYRIADRAGQLAFRAGAILMALMAATLTALSRSGYPALEQAGMVLAYAVGAELLIYYIGYLSYSKKLGGE